MFVYSCCYVCSVLGIVFHRVVLCTVYVQMCTVYYSHRVSTQLELSNISYHIKLIDLHACLTR